MVHPEKQIWHCFGCGKGGDVISFVQEMEGLEFVEALKLLAKRAGVEIDVRNNEMNQSQRNRLLEINAAAAYFFHHFLLEIPAAEIARQYLEKRGLSSTTIADWQIGYIPEQWDLLTKYLLKKGFGIGDLVLSGLTMKREGADVNSGRGVYDRFRGRVMFPIADTHGNVVGFTGRVLVEKENTGKYMNTPQTILYDKSRVIYGIHRAKTEIKAKDQAILVEGQMDVVACHQAGMKNVVAASGTALTVEQIKMLKRYTNNLAMAFDSDNAGQKAGQRGIAVAVEQGMNVKVIQIPPGAGKDADECLKKNPEVWFRAVKDAVGIMDWYFSITLSGLDKKDFSAKQKAATTLLQEIARIPHGVERDEWLKRLSEELAVDVGVLREEAKKLKTSSQPFKNQNPAAVPAESRPMATTQLERLIEDFWALLLKHPGVYGELKQLKSEYFTGSRYGALYEICQNVYNKETRLDLVNLRNLAAGNDGNNTIDVLLLKPTGDFSTDKEAQKELEQIVSRIHEEWRRSKGKELQLAIAAAQRVGNKEEMERLLLEIQSLG